MRKKDSDVISIKVSPFLRWAGGKRNLVKRLIRYVPPDYNDRGYFEPFLGAGSLFFALCPRNAILSDLNKHLVHCFNVTKNKPLQLHSRLSAYRNLAHECNYYQIRDLFNKNLSSFSITQAARFLYLNRTCYNGIFRVNKTGIFNVPFGKKNPWFPNKEDITNVSRALKSAALHAFSYTNIASLVNPGDFVYLDPPYPPINGSSYFTHYTKEKFTADDQLELFAFAEALKQKKCKVLISNANIPIIRNLYKKWHIFDVEVTRFISCKSKRHKMGELVITNYKAG